MQFLKYILLLGSLGSAHALQAPWTRAILPGSSENPNRGSADVG